MRRVLRAIVVAEIIAAVWLGTLSGRFGGISDGWARSAGRRLGKLSAKFRGAE